MKIGKNHTIVNLELKSQPVEREKIEKQLLKNRYYLSHLSTNIYTFALVRDNHVIKLYTYDTCLRDSSFEEFIEKLYEVDNPIMKGIENLFKPSDYLISPLNTPEKFLKGNYYLTLQQEQIKNEVIKNSIGIKCMWGITGTAGTGKTLLLYDIAKELSKRTAVCIVHCGMLSEGHKIINSKMRNVTVLDAKSATQETLQKYRIVCVDETQRIYLPGITKILDLYENGCIETCIFSYFFFYQKYVGFK